MNVQRLRELIADLPGDAELYVVGDDGLPAPVDVLRYGYPHIYIEPGYAENWKPILRHAETLK